MPSQPELRSAQPNTATLQSLSRGLRALSVVLESANGLSLSELADAMGIHKATVLRIVRTLVDEGYVTADPRGPRYFPGPAVLSYSARNHMSALAQVARPIISELSAASRETVALFVPAWPDLVCCAATPSPELIRRHREVGESQPMTRASAGRAFLAYAPPDYVTATLQARPLQERTKHSVTDQEQFREALREAFRKGYSASFQEVNLEMAGLAAPVVTSATALPLAVITVSGPLFRWGPGQIEAFVSTLIGAARRFGQQVTSLHEDAASTRGRITNA